MEQLQLPAELHDWRPGAIDARAEISRLWAAGYTTASITRSLNGRGVPTPSGRGQWHDGSVRRYADPTAALHWREYIRRYRRDRR